MKQKRGPGNRKGNYSLKKKGKEPEKKEVGI